MNKELKEQFLYWCDNWYRTDIKVFDFELLYAGPRTAAFISRLEAGGSLDNSYKILYKQAINEVLNKLKDVK